jgi:hypothetical protein
VRLTTRRCGDIAPVKKKYLKFRYVSLRGHCSTAAVKMIRTVLVLLGSLLLSSWFYVRNRCEGRAVWRLGCKSGRGSLAILVKGELNG